MRRILSFVLACGLLMSIFTFTAAATGSNAESQEQDYTPIYVDGADADPQMLAYTVKSEIYVPLETVSIALGSEFYTWNSALQSASLMAQDLFVTVSAEKDYIVANGKNISISNGLQIKEGIPMVPVRQLCKAFDVGVEIKDDAVEIDTMSDYTEPASKESSQTEKSSSSSSSNITTTTGDSYDGDEDDLYWLSRIIYAEAGGEGMTGMIAVGNVVLNRVRSSSFPNTIKGVIFDTKSGVQFSPAYSGRIYNTPSADAVEAARQALAGVNVVGNSLYFNPASRDSWASRNCEFVTQIGNHCFYA